MAPFRFVRVIGFKMITNTLFVGVGSLYGDDRIGWHVAAAIAGRVQGVQSELPSTATSQVKPRALPHSRIVVRKAGSPADVLDWLPGVNRLVICDACRSGGPAGHAYRWTWPDPAIEQAHCSGTHDLDLANVLELAQNLHCLPPTVVVWGIEAENLNPQDLLPSGGLSTGVAEQIDQIAETIWRDLCSWQPD